MWCNISCCKIITTSGSGVLCPGTLRNVKPYINISKVVLRIYSVLLTQHVGYWIKQGAYPRDACVGADTRDINMKWQRRGTSCNSEHAILLCWIFPSPPPPPTFFLSVFLSERPPGLLQCTSWDETWSWGEGALQHFTLTYIVCRTTVGGTG